MITEAERNAKLKSVLKELKLKFTSSNSVPVTRASISREEFDVIYSYIVKMTTTEILEEDRILYDDPELY